MQGKNISRIEPKDDIKMYIVICGGNEITQGGRAHAAVCFSHEVAVAEKIVMERSGYPCKGIFEISALNIFSVIPRYLQVQMKK